LFVDPRGLAVEADGNILIADPDAFDGGGGVIRVNPETGTQTKVSSGNMFVAPLGVAVEADGNILVVDSEAFSGNGGVIRVNPQTGTQTKVSSGGGPAGVAVVNQVLGAG
jgi:DNA-binding beta-propeller fold protein YncE